MLKRLIAHLGLRGSVDVVEREEEIFADVSGPELGLLIGKHGSTLDAIQFICSQAAFRGAADRKRVVVDAAGYRERREATLRRQADRGVADALRYGRPVELDSMGAPGAQGGAHLSEGPPGGRHAQRGRRALPPHRDHPAAAELIARRKT